MNWQEVQRAVRTWYAESGRDLPWRRTRDPYAILVAEFMLQQTQVDRVLSSYQAFLARFPSFAVLSSAPVAEVIRAWQGLGYNRRAVRLHRIAQVVCTEYAGQLPDTIDGLMALDGIGRYTASAVACFAFGQNVPMLDTNVRRVLDRMAYSPDDPHASGSASQWALATQALPEDNAYAWNQALMDLGATICTVSSPKCLICPVSSWCSTAGRAPRLLRERKVRYAAAVAAPYAGSSRYYRGRIVEHLRRLGDRESISTLDLGVGIKSDYSEEDAAWLDELLGALEHEGLVARRADGTVGLP